MHAARTGEEALSHVVRVQVVCRQLGFRFGGIYDVGEDRRSDFLPGDYTDEFYRDDYEPGIAFATEVPPSPLRLTPSSVPSTMDYLRRV